MVSKIKDYFLRFYYYFFDRFIIYPLMQIIPKQFDIQFMNLGYSSVPYEAAKETTASDDRIKNIMDKYLEASDDLNKAHIALYEKALSMCPAYPSLTNFNIVEVGCGLGGGVKWIKRAHPEINTIVGVDKIINPSDDGMFVEGNAEDLPFPRSSKDLVINIESSHLYDNPQKFFNEVYRILKPNGYLCWADLRYQNQMAKALEEASQANLHLIAYENITAEVLNGIEFTSKRYDQILEKAPWFIKAFQNSIRATYCAPGTHTYNRFAKRKKIYATACWIKKVV